jgi:hypothetical protein
MKDWSDNNFWNYFISYASKIAIAILIIFFVWGVIAWLNFPNNTKPSKHYPIEVKLHWETDQGAGYPTMDVDSVKGDTVYKDGNSIVVKNIINIQFK